jgi:RimK-like ATP-grasp domain
VIGIAGTRADPVLVHFAARCLVRDVPFAVIDLPDVAAYGGWHLSVPPRPADVVAGAETVRLGELTGIYVRPIYLGRTKAEWTRWYGLLDGFTAWLEETDVRVVNRPGAHQLNSCKPAHYAWLAANGLLVPPSLLSRDPVRLKEFVEGGRTVVKPVCGTRATTREVPAGSLERLATTEGPVLVQRLIEGDDVRVHVVRDRVVACRFASTAIDYRSDRYARRSVVEIPAELERRLVEKTAAQGLVFAGWDFKVDRDGTYWCLECNPMPGYSMYDRVCGGAVSDALISELSGADGS